MNYAIVIPTYNEEKFIAFTLQSLVEQTVLPTKIVVVNDSSTDHTEKIVQTFVDTYPFISLVHKKSAANHQPGSKVIHAFNQGWYTIAEVTLDVIAKIDADLIFPSNYFETILNHFQSDANIGMAGGFCYIENEGNWVLESLTDQDHIRGALKAYRKEAFNQIGGLQPQMGWDTLDELLCKFYGWKVVTDVSLQVKHLKPTGANYAPNAAKKQGEAFYSIGYGFWITCIASLKLAWKKKSVRFLIAYLQGFLQSWLARKPKMVNKAQERFIRKYRWKKMMAKLKI
jgi:glycosyltransferase involved in cell wall biosynthesis